jgi:hypothetical protein
MLCNLALQNFENSITETNNQDFKDKTKIDLLLFPKNSINANKKIFYLKIKQRESIPSLLFFNLLIELVGMRSLMFNQPRHSLALWEKDFKIDSDQIEMEIDLTFPHLFFTLNGVRKEASMRKVKNITENSLYMLYFFLYNGFQKTCILKNCIVVHMDNLKF